MGRRKSRSGGINISNSKVHVGGDIVGRDKKQIETRQEKRYVSDADDHYYAGEYAQAKHLYEKALALAPDDKHALTYLTKAIENLAREESKARLPREATQFYRRAKSLFVAGNLESTVVTLRRAIEIAKFAEVPFPEAEEMLITIEKELEQRKQPSVFISYSRDDFEIANEIYEFLRENGCVPWMDKYDLVPGQDWELEINRNIKVSDFFVACLSNNSVSKRGYVQKELKYAMSVLDEFPDGKIYLIPIRIADCVIPEALASRQWLDWSMSNAKQQLLRAIRLKE
ncbi:MAG: TIR domain-containing protein [Chloroflexi bacterium]|nr:TIR domain-containing protein [Chloroflexota bacterium]